MIQFLSHHHNNYTITAILCRVLAFFGADKSWSLSKYFRTCVISHVNRHKCELFSVTRILWWFDGSWKLTLCLIKLMTSSVFTMVSEVEPRFPVGTFGFNVCLWGLSLKAFPCICLVTLCFVVIGSTVFALLGSSFSLSAVVTRGVSCFFTAHLRYSSPICPMNC